jgi:hypothetical protein
MFTKKISTENEADALNESQHGKMVKSSKFKNIISQPSSDNLYQNSEMSSQNIHDMLDKEQQHNKTESWNKLDKTIKIQKLHIFAERYGKDNGFSVKDIKSLKAFFNDCLEKNKLQKTKDVCYDKDAREISSIPSLFFNSINRNFTLKNMDSKRVSTLKSLTPKRTSNKNLEDLDLPEK